MIEIRLSVKRVKGTVDREGAMATARRVGRVEVTNMCRKIMNQAVIDCPVATGNLRSHHTMRVRELKTKIRGSVVNITNYAAAVHDGGRSGPHVIRARKKRALAFKLGGKMVIVRSVRHPGSTTKARPWLRNAAERVAVANGWRFQRTTQAE